MTHVLVHPENSLDSTWRCAELDDMIKNIACFWAAGMTQSFVGFPLDTLKFLMQAQPTATHTLIGNRPVPPGALAAMRAVCAHSGIRGLWTGAMMPTLVGAPLTLATGFYAHQRAVAAFHSSGHNPDLVASLYAGAWAGFWMSIPETVFDLMKLQTQARIYSLTGSLAAIPVRNIPANAVYFYTFDCVSLKLRTAERDLPNSDAQIMAAGACSSTAYWLLAYPLDTLKTRMQADENFRGRAAFPNFKSVLASRHSPLMGGWRGLWRGILPTLIKAAPANALGFLAFERIRSQSW